MIGYLNIYCSDCNGPVHAIESNDGIVAECTVCLNKIAEYDGINEMLKNGIKVIGKNLHDVTAKKTKPFYNTQLIEFEGKQLSISRSGKFYFTQIIDGDKKTPLRPFCSLAEAAQIYPVINTIKITI